MTFRLNTPSMYFRHIKVSWVQYLPDFVFVYLHFNVKAGENQETFLRKHFDNVAWVSKREGSRSWEANSASSTYVAWVRKRGNNRETFEVSISSVFPKWFFVCANKQYMLKTHNLCLESRKCFWNFPKHFLRPGRNFASATMFPRLRWP